MNMNNLVEELEKLSLTPDFITEFQAQQVIQLINDKITDLLEPQIIDVLWQQEGLDGIILSPMITMCVERSVRGGARPFQIVMGADAPTGIWAWLYEHSKPVWIENILSKDLTQPIRNEATGDYIEPKYLRIFQDTDSIMAFPLITKKSVWGIYSIELPRSGRFTRDTLTSLMRLSGPIARILWKVDALKFTQEHTSRAIGLFRDAIRQTPVTDEISLYRTGFIARPFEQKFKTVEDCVSAFMERKGIQAEHYRHPPGRGYVVDEIMSKIKSAHFGIADVTGNNPNVMLELGMLMLLRKKVLLFREKDDPSEDPFNIGGFHLYRYKVEPGPTLHLWSPGSSEYESLDKVLTLFIRELERDPNFVRAREWTR